MRVFIACPAPPQSRKGNRVSAARWTELLRQAGHRVTVDQLYADQNCDVMVALHARRSYPAIRAYRRTCPGGPLIVVLTGTDLYRDIHTHRQAQQSLMWADSLVVLQRLGIRELPARLRTKAQVIYQSAVPLVSPPPKNEDVFEVCVLGHLRYEKDPLRAALALRRLPRDSRVRVLHAGEALTAGWTRRARQAEARDPRYRWLGEIPRLQARRLLARSRCMVLGSRMEGGANVISEAIAEGVPVLASRIPGSVGLLGDRYPGYFPVADTAALARLMHRVETDPVFYSRLEEWCRRLTPLVDPIRERTAWDRLLKEVGAQS